MSSRFAVPVVALVMVVVGAATGWLLERKPDAAAPPPPAPVVVVPEEVAVDVIPPPRPAADDADARFRRALALLQAAPPPHDPRSAGELSKPVFDLSAAAKAALRNSAESRPEERKRLESQVAQLAAEEGKYQQKLLRAGEEWLNASANLAAVSAEKPGAAARATKQTLRAFIKNPIRDGGAATAAMNLEHLRQAQLEAVVHRVAGKDHGDTAVLVAQWMPHGTAGERLEAIDDEEADAGQVHAAWRVELAERFHKGDKGTPAEVAAFLLSGCFPAAKPDKPSGADFAFLDPARNPELVSATEKGPVRRILTAWSANHAKDPAATAAAAALLKAGEKK